MRAIEAEEANVLSAQPALAEGTDAFAKSLHALIIIPCSRDFNKLLGCIVSLIIVD
jgi:hypothetical protein